MTASDSDDASRALASARRLSTDAECHGAHAHLARLKSLGCMALRDGAYLLPGSADRAPEQKQLADECLREGGSAWPMRVQPRSAEEAAAYRLFDRSDEYAGLRSAWKTANAAGRDEHRSRFVLCPLRPRDPARQGLRKNPMSDTPTRQASAPPAYSLLQLVRYMLGLGT